MLNSRVQSVCNEAFNELAKLFPSTRCGTTVPVDVNAGSCDTDAVSSNLASQRGVNA